MSDQHTTRTEVTEAYRTLDEPSKLLGLSGGQWGAVVTAAALGYLWIMLSPLPWRLNLSAVAVVGGAPLMLLLLREQGALSPGALVLAVVRWRSRPALLLEARAGDVEDEGLVVLAEDVDYGGAGGREEAP